MTLASGSATLVGGAKSAKVTLKLTPAGKQLLAKYKTLKATIAATSGGTTVGHASATLSATKAKH